MGGWNLVHPDPSLGSDAAYNAWNDWNKNVVARNGFPGFDGLDIDLEGFDEVNAAGNTYSPELIQMVGEMAQKAKGMCTSNNLYI